MYVIMNNYFRSSLINEPAVTIFVLCSYLLQIQTSSVDAVKPTYWGAVIKDVQKIKNYKNYSTDVSLYTADLNYPIACNISVVKCFFEELQVIVHESKIGGDTGFSDEVSRMARLVKSFLDQQEWHTWHQLLLQAEAIDIWSPNAILKGKVTLGAPTATFASILFLPSLSFLQRNGTSKCPRCETFEEKPYDKFMDNFNHVAQRFNTEELHSKR